MNSFSIWPAVHTSSILSLDCNETGIVVSGAEAGDVCLWDGSNRMLIHQLQGFPDEVTAVCCSKRNSNFFWVASDCLVMKFDLRNHCEALSTLCYSDDDVNMIAFNDSETLMSFCDDQGVSLLTLFIGQCSVCPKLCF